LVLLKSTAVILLFWKAPAPISYGLATPSKLTILLSLKASVHIIIFPSASNHKEISSFPGHILLL
jgi:hypothetical protein